MYHKIHNNTRIQLPYDVIDFVYNNYNTKRLMSMTNNRYKDKFMYESKMAKKIQEWYRERLFVDWEHWSKKRIVRAYYSNYDWHYLKNYPTFLVKKCNKPELKEKALEAENDGTRRSIIKFLELDEISKNDILYTGW